MTSLARPLWLPGSPGPAFGFLHEPPDGHISSALVICPPFGWEEICAHRGLREWATRLADHGVAALRLSYPALGDSGGDPRDPDLIGAWTDATRDALAALANAYPGRRVAAIGIGLGGLLVCRAAAAGSPVDDLILWSVPATGRALLRELTAHSSMVAARYPADNRPTEALPDGAVEAVGFLIDSDTAAALRALRIDELTLPPREGRRALLLSRDRLPVDKTLQAWLEASGSTVTVDHGMGYGAMTAHPQESVAPSETIGFTLQWLSTAPEPPEAAQLAEPTAASAPEGALGHGHDVVTLGLNGDRVRETATFLAADPTPLFSVVSEPAGADAGPVTAVFLSAGSLGHVGPNRTWVELARAWAARGIPVARVDFEGIGDTDGDPRQYVSDRGFYVHAAERVEQLIGTLDVLEARGLPPRFVLVGLCSGAYWGFHAALRDERIVGAYLLNLYSFFWSPELADERDPGVTLSKLRSQGLGRLVRRDVTAPQIVQSLRRIARTPLRLRLDRAVERAQRPRIVEALEVLHDREVDLVLMLGDGEPLSGQLERDFADELARWPNISVEPIPTADHMFRALWLQAHVKSALGRALERTTQRIAQRDAGSSVRGG